MTEASVRRKPHSKSRRGCLSCKKRHTKCNEVQPRCANCTRLKILCTWPSSSRNGSPTSLSHSAESDAPNSSIQIQASPPTSALAIDDMRLLHHWTTKVTFLHCSPSSSFVPVWSLNAMEIAFEQPFVLHGILAFSALHKLIHNLVSDRTVLLAQADAHISSSLAVYRELVQQPTLEKALPMFFLSGILFAYNLATAQLREPEDPIGDFLHCLRLLRGVREVVGQYWQALSKSPIVHEMLSSVTDIEGLPVPEDEKGTFVPLEQLKKLTAELEEPGRQALVQAIDDLRRTYLRAQVCRDEQHEHSVFMTWPARLSDEFLNLVEVRNFVVVIIVAYFAVAMRNWTYAWWMTGWPERILGATANLLEAVPELKGWLEWPLQKINSTLSNGR